MPAWATPKRARLVDIITGLVVLAVLIGVGRIAMFGRDAPVPQRAEPGIPGGRWEPGRRR